MEPSRVRPRFDYSDSGRGTHFRGMGFNGRVVFFLLSFGSKFKILLVIRLMSFYNPLSDGFGAGSSLYSSGYYGPDVRVSYFKRIYLS